MKKRIKKLTNEQIDLLKHSIDIHFDSAYWLDRNNNFIYINNKGCKSLGYEYEELIGRNVNVVNPRATEKVQKEVWDQLREKGSFIAESILRRKDGSEFPIEISSTYVIFDGKEYNCGFARDITERKKAEEQLKKSEEKYRLLAEKSKALICEVNTRGEFIFVNSAFKDILGYEPEELLGKTPFDIGDPEEKENGETKLTKAGNINDAQQNVWKFFDKNRNPHFLNCFSNTYMTSDGQIRINTIAFEITELKKLNEALKESEKRYKKLVSSLTDYIYSVNIKDGTPVSTQYGPGCITVTGYSSSEFENDPYLWYNIIYNDDKDLITKLSSKLVNGEEIEPFEHRIIHKNGSIRWIRNSHVIRKNFNGDFEGYDGLIEDITERKLVEEALRDSESKYRNLFNNAQVSMFRSKLDGSAFLDFNDHLLKIFDRTREEMKGVPSINFWVDLHEREEMVNMLKRDGKVFDFECKMWSKDGKVKNCLISVRLYLEDGILEGSIIDITERKLVEEKINKLNIELEKRVAKRTEELISVNKELEAFSYSVAHDLKAPLRAINGFSSILMENYLDKVDKEAQNYLNLIKTNIQKMDTLIYDLLELSKIYRHEISFSKIDFNSMVNSIYNEIATPDVKEAFSFKVKSLPDSYGDSHLMHQVWINLLSNALKYTMKSKIKRIEVNGYKEGDNNIYYVKDSGVGFNPEYKNKLFGVFQRLHKTEEFEGTGVGLAIVQRIINRHKGKVWAEGEENNGATFYFSLPNIKIDNEQSK